MENKLLYISLLTALLLISLITAETIQLKNNPKTSNTETIKINNSVIYESKNQLIIKYSTFSFALLCVILSILINWNNFRK